MVAHVKGHSVCRALFLSEGIGEGFVAIDCRRRGIGIPGAAGVARVGFHAHGDMDRFFPGFNTFLLVRGGAVSPGAVDDFVGHGVNFFAAAQAFAVRSGGVGNRNRDSKIIIQIIFAKIYEGSAMDGHRACRISRQEIAPVGAQITGCRVGMAAGHCQRLPHALDAIFAQVPVVENDIIIIKMAVFIERYLRNRISLGGAAF